MFGCLTSRWHFGASRVSVPRALLVGLWCVLALLASANAHASAPMCDPSAATVAAELPAPPADGGEIDALPPCPLSEISNLGFAHSKPEAPNPPLELQLDRGLPPDGSILWPAPILERKLNIEIHAQPGLGFESEVYRPPCC